MHLSTSATPRQTPAAARGAARHVRRDCIVLHTRSQSLLAGLAGAALLAAPLPQAQASGLESVALPTMPDTPQVIKDLQNRNRGAHAQLSPRCRQARPPNNTPLTVAPPVCAATLDKADASFQSSELLRSLKERSETNKDQRARDLRDLYCRRQAEMGVGDCAGLRLIPGATKSGIQKKPAWLESLLGGGDDGGVAAE